MSPTNQIAQGDASKSFPLTRTDLMSDQEVRWCPGCGDYAILSTVQGFLPKLGIPRENMVFISGIGCSSRFPYYLNTYGMHSIHGRAPSIATGLAATRKDLSIWVVTGDGDALSIGGNHLIHALRRNVNITILLFNNRVYGLTKGQYSPTSERGTVSKSTPLGSLESPLDPVTLALGANATFVARSVDTDREHLTGVLQAAARHEGASLVEIYQNCPVFNDGALAGIRTPAGGATPLVRLTDGEPVVSFSTGEPRALARNANGGLSWVGQDMFSTATLVTHVATTDCMTHSFAMARLGDLESGAVPIGIFRQVEKPTYDSAVRQQLQEAMHQHGGAPTSADYDALLGGPDSWVVE